MDVHKNILIYFFKYQNLKYNVHVHQKLSLTKLECTLHTANFLKLYLAILCQTMIGENIIKQEIMALLKINISVIPLVYV